MVYLIGLISSASGLQLIMLYILYRKIHVCQKDISKLVMSIRARWREL